MTLGITLTAVAGFFSAAAILILALLVAGIRSDDRAKSAPRSRTEQVTRQLLGVGVRTTGADHASTRPPGTASCPFLPESDLP
jgi:hypothetical protein